MNITVKNQRDNSIKTTTLNGTLVKDLLRQLNINPETVLIIRNNEVITESHHLEDKDTIEILSVISGGWIWIVSNVLKNP